MPRKRLHHTLEGWFDAVLARAGTAFMDNWARLERGYRRPQAWLALRLKFAFYPLLALAALGWLAWDWSHARSLDAAEDTIFDTVIQWRPFEPKPSGKVVIVEIDDCSIGHYRAQGEGGWPWPRQRHADLLDMLDRAGARAVGVDVMFADPSGDAVGDAMLEEMAEGGAGRFLFASSRLHPDFDARAPLHAADAPGAFRLGAAAVAPGPRIALMPPYGDAMTRHSGLVNVARNDDGVLRDMVLHQQAGDWAVPSLPLRLAVQATGRDPAGWPRTVRPDWRTKTRQPYVSAADVIAGEPVCGDAAALARLDGAVVLVGHTAAGINDAKPTPVNAAMPGVEVLAEATDALVSGSAIRVPPVSLKYLLAAVLVVLTAFAFWRGEPHEDVDSVFIATNLALLGGAFAGLTFFGTFLDIFAAVGFVSLCFGLCRLYAGVQRGRAVGNNDFIEGYDPAAHPWLVMARLRFAPYRDRPEHQVPRLIREYRRRLRRFLYAGTGAVMLEGVVERKSWLHEKLDDLMVLVWHGGSEAEARAAARADLDRLFARMNAADQDLDDGGDVLVSVAAAEVDDDDDGSGRGERLRLRELLGRELDLSHEWPLRAANTFIHDDDGRHGHPGGAPCDAQPPSNP